MGPTFRCGALSAAAVALLAAAPPARADWEGKMKVTRTPEGKRWMQEGKISGKGTRMRFDIEPPKGEEEMARSMGPVAAIFDFRAGKMTMLMLQRHAFMQMDMDKGDDSGPARRGPRGPGVKCESDDPVACLEKSGYRKTGSETVNGFKSAVWERDRDRGEGKAHEKLYIPEGFKDFAMVRHVTVYGDQTEQLDVLELKKASQPEANFTIPEGYQDMGTMMGPPGGRGGRGPGGRPPGMPPGMPPSSPPGGGETPH